jgi:hypothetical protein
MSGCLLLTQSGHRRLRIAAVQLDLRTPFRQSQIPAVIAAKGVARQTPQWQHVSLVLNEHYEEDGEIVFREVCKLGCEGIVSKRLGSMYRRGRSPHWVKVKNPNAPAVKREAEEDWR